MNGYEGNNNNVQVIYEEKPKIFDTEINNNEISLRIKKYAKYFFKFYYVLSIILLVFGAFVAICTIEDSEGLSILMYAGFFLIQFISMVVAYISFLFLSGYGALIQDVNSLKETIAPKKSEKKTK